MISCNLQCTRDIHVDAFCQFYANLLHHFAESKLCIQICIYFRMSAKLCRFLSHLFYCKCTSPLAQIFMLDATRFRKLLEDNAANTWPGCEEDFKSRDASLDLLAETFHIRSRDPFQRVKELQTGFDPSVLNFSDAYYDTLGLEKPKRGMQRKEKPLFEFPPITFDLYQEDDP